MKNKRFKTYMLTLTALFTGALLCFAQGSFQNNLLKADLYKNSLGEIKLTIYTNKPYPESIHINKKNDYEYTILLPETANSTTAKPSLAAVSDIVKDVQIKTQQYQNNIKGYTKITITTLKPAEITTQTKVLTITDAKISEKDYKELLAQTSKQNTKNKVQNVQKPIIAKTTQAKQETKPLKQLEKPVEKSKTQVKTSLKTQPKVRTKIQPKIQEKEKSPAKKAAPAIAIKTEPIETAPAKKEPVIQKDLAPHPDVITPEEPKPVKAELQPKQQIQTQKISKVQKVKNIAHKIINLLKTNILITLGAIAAVFIILLLAAKKLSGDIKKQKEIFTAHLKEQPHQTLNFEEQISEDMDWREKFQTYKEVTQETSKTDSEDSEPENSEEIDSLFSEDEFETYTSYQESQEEEENQDELSSQENAEVQTNYGTTFADVQSEFEDYSTQEADLNELFADEEEIIEPKTYFEQSIEDFSQTHPAQADEQEQSETEMVKAEYSIDEQKGFYLVDFEEKTSLLGHINDEIFVLKTFDEKIDAPIQARLNEKKSSSQNYMTKVGNFKGIVEVTSDKMNLLIEL